MPWSSYYPGFSESFATDIIHSFELTASEILLDPWNGSGTTTAAAARLGKHSIGIDINPSMAIIARAREIHWNDIGLIQERLNEVASSINPQNPPETTSHYEPLGFWFDIRTSEQIRSIADLIMYRPSSPQSERLDTINSFLFLALSHAV